LTGSRLFTDTNAASAFFQGGAVDDSPARGAIRFDGIELRSDAWHIEPAEIDHVRSSLFGDRAAFPSRTIELDCALVMRNVRVTWHDAGSIMVGRKDRLLVGERWLGVARRIGSEPPVRRQWWPSAESNR
jgi:hypothetical protein